jgi:hypothetical protein
LSLMFSPYPGLDPENLNQSQYFRERGATEVEYINKFRPRHNWT